MRLPVLLFLAGLMGGSACYRPNIKDGALACAVPGDLCPEGFSCFTGYCFRRGADGPGSEVNDGGPDKGGGEVGDAGGHGSGGAGGAAGTGGRGNGTGGAATGGTAGCTKREPTPGCTPDQKLACDPVCQTGCCSGEKCSAKNTGDANTTEAALGCSSLSATSPWGLGDNCDPINRGTPNRTDNCGPGLVCVDGNVNASICFKLCRTNADCTDGTKCETRLLEPNGTRSVSVCSLQPTPCDATNRTTICPNKRVCYLIESSTAGDRTVCEISAGQGGNQTACRTPSQCALGLTCPSSGSGQGRCTPVCSHTMAPTNFCPGTLTCASQGKEYDLCL